MSDKEQSPPASPMNDSPKSPGTGSASPKSAADEAAAAAAAATGQRATSRSPSPAGGAAAADARAPRAEGAVSNQGNNLYLANLPVRMSQFELEEMCSKFGRVEKCEVICDPVTRESRCFGFVSFEDTRDASDAVTELNGKEIMGRRIRVEHAKRQRGHEKTPGKYLGPHQASTKYGDGGRRRSRSRSRDRGRRFESRDRSRSRDRGRRFDSRDRYDRGRYDDRSRGRYDDRDRYDRRR